MSANPRDAVPEAISENRVSFAETKRNVFTVYIPVTHSPQDLERPTYWRHNARRFHRGDWLECEREDGQWFVLLRVLDAGTNWLRVKVALALEQEVLPPADKTAQLAGHQVKWGGHFVKWRVIREADNFVLQEDLESEAAAYMWLAQYAKTIDRNEVPMQKVKK